MSSYRVDRRRAVVLSAYMAAFSFGILLAGLLTNTIVAAAVGGCGVGWFTACALGAAGRFGQNMKGAEGDR